MLCFQVGMWHERDTKKAMAFASAQTVLLKYLFQDNKRGNVILNIDV